MKSKETGTSLNSFRVLRHGSSWLTTCLLLLIIGLTAAETGIGNEIGIYPSKVFELISHKNFDGLGKNLAIYLVYQTCICLVIGFKTWISKRTAILFRKNLDEHMQEKYFQENSFHDILLYEKEIDNPDGRLTNDCQFWAETFSTLFLLIAQMPIYVVWYGIKTIIIMGGVGFTICLSFGIIIIVCSRLVMTPIIKLTYSYEETNADFRKKHIDIKEDSEIICLSRAQSHELRLLDEGLKKVLKAQFGLANFTILLNSVTSTFNYFGNGLVYLCIYVCVPPGTVSYDEIAQYISRVSFFVLEFIFGISMLTSVMDQFAKLCGYSNRIQDLWKYLENHVSQVESPIHENRIKMENVNVVKPDGRALINDLSFTIEQNESLFISGPSGVGKSSIFRVLGTVWPADGGTITVPNNGPENIMVLTQTPYIPLGSVEEVCCFPFNPDMYNEQLIFSAINSLSLNHLFDRSKETWQDGLSPGEKQRIALARVLIHKPRFLLLDEATSTIPTNLEDTIFQMLFSMDMSIITIAHNQRLKKYHKYSLELNNDLTYSLYPNSDA